MKLYQPYTKLDQNFELLAINGGKAMARRGQTWGSFWARKLAYRLLIPSGRWHDHGHAGKYADMPRHAVGKKRYQMMPNDTKIKAMLEIKNCAKLHQIVPKKLNQNKPKCTKK